MNEDTPPPVARSVRRTPWRAQPPGRPAEEEEAGERRHRGGLRPAWTELAALALAAVALCWNLGAGSLLSSDDAIYAEMAREMARSGHWLATTWLGTVVFEKPPLLVWLLRLSGGAFGWSTLAMRLPGVLAGLVALAYTARLARLTVPAGARAARLVAGPLAIALVVSAVAFTMTVRRPLTDPLLAAAVMASAWYAARSARVGGPGAAIGLGLAGGLGVMAKFVAIGPVALVAAVALIARRRWRELALAAAVSLAVAAPWHLAMTARYGAKFWSVYLGYHVLARVDGPLVGHAGLAYYARTAFALDHGLAIVWLVGLAGGLGAAVRARRRGLIGAMLVLAIVVATGWLTVAAIQLTATRLYHYLLPIVPLAAVATVGTLAQLGPAPRPLLGRLPTVFLVLLFAAFSFITGPLEPHLTRPDYSAHSRLLATLLRERLPAKARLVIWDDYDPALIFYVDRPARFWVDQRRAYRAQHAIDMLRRSHAVVWASDAAIGRLIASPEDVVIVVPLARRHALDRVIARAMALRRVRVADDVATEHRVVWLGAFKRGRAGSETRADRQEDGRER